MTTRLGAVAAVTFVVTLLIALGTYLVMPLYYQAAAGAVEKQTGLGLVVTTMIIVAAAGFLWGVATKEE